MTGRGALRLDPRVMINRRHLLGMTLAACCAPCMAAAQGAAPPDPIGDLLARPLDTREARRLNLYHLHTHEAVDVIYWEKGEYIPDALAAINMTLRDFRSGHVWPIDVRTLDMVSATAAAVGNPRPLQIVSAYRSPATNAMLRARSGEVAENSVHTEGMAIDFYLDDTPIDRLHAAAVAQNAGGVGLYPDTGFIHMDASRVRYWQGT